MALITFPGVPSVSMTTFDLHQTARVLDQHSSTAPQWSDGSATHFSFTGTGLIHGFTGPNLTNITFTSFTAVFNGITVTSVGSGQNVGVMLRVCCSQLSGDRRGQRLW